MKKRYDFSNAPRGVLYGKIKTVRGKPHVPPQSLTETITVSLTLDEAQAVALIVEGMSADDLAKLTGVSDETAQQFLSEARTAINKIKAA